MSDQSFDWGVPVHECIVSTEGVLNTRAKRIPKLRKAVENLAETKATFRCRYFLDDRALSARQVRFIGAWQSPTEVGGEMSTMWVNPNYVHTHKYPAVVVRCECGARVDAAYDGKHSHLDSAHQHTDECMPHWRLEARAEFQRQRYEMLQDLIPLGWESPDFANAFGFTKNNIGAMNREFGILMRDARDKYRRRAGNTYHILTNHGEAAKQIAEIYDHSISTLGRWRKRYGDFNPDEAVDIEATAGYS